MPVAVYSVDTSALIDGLERYYQPANFPSLWRRVDELVEAGRFVCSEEVIEEAGKRDLAANAWCKQRGAELMVATDARVAEVVSALLGAYPKITKELKGRNRADPFVIAVAQIKGATVVTGEGQNGSENRPKIPWVCARLGIACISFTQLIQEEGWRF